MTWAWLERWLLPIEDLPTTPPEAVDDEARTLAEADRAAREFERVKRRARSVGIDVDITRSWGPRS